MIAPFRLTDDALELLVVRCHMFRNPADHYELRMQLALSVQQ